MSCWWGVVLDHVCVLVCDVCVVYVVVCLLMNCLLKCDVCFLVVGVVCWCGVVVVIVCDDIIFGCV